MLATGTNGSRIKSGMTVGILHAQRRLFCAVAPHWPSGQARGWRRWVGHVWCM